MRYVLSSMLGLSKNNPITFKLFNLNSRETFYETEFSITYFYKGTNKSAHARNSCLE